MSGICIIAPLLLLALALIFPNWNKSRKILRQDRNSRKFGPYLGANIVISVGVFLVIIIVTGIVPQVMSDSDVVVVDFFVLGFVSGPLIAIIWLIWSVVVWFKTKNSSTSFNKADSRKKLKNEDIALDTVDEVVAEGDMVNRIVRDSETEDKAKVSIVSNEISQTTFTFSGMGKEVTPSVFLAKGRYRIGYEFPSEGSIAVRLTNTKDLDAEEEQILWESGKGSSNFVVKVAGTYVLQLLPLNTPDNAKWHIKVDLL